MRREEAIGLLPSAIKRVQAEIRWKPGSAGRHLFKRRFYGHLPLEATLEDYHALIRKVVTSDDASVFLHWYKEDAYPAVATTVGGRVWLVMFSLEGILESAYVVIDPDSYLTSPKFDFVGPLNEVIT
jgi:hypothetical protein